MSSQGMWPVLQLLDTVLDQPLQTWSFGDETLIRIGRSLDNEVVIDNPGVSRSHAYLRPVEGRWELDALSAQGVYVDGAQRTQVKLEDGVVFRLGQHGPKLRFLLILDQARKAPETVVAGPGRRPVFQYDEEKEAAEVLEITNTSFFQHLRESTEKFRRGRDEERPQGSA